MKASFRIMIFLIIAMFSAGCATVEYGVWPNTDQLSNLRLEQSTAAEIRQLMGEPTGMGKGRMPDFPETTDVWSYEYQRATGSTVNISILLIFLREDKYQGYFWFVADDTVRKSVSSR